MTLGLIPDFWLVKPLLHTVTVLQWISLSPKVTAIKPENRLECELLSLGNHILSLVLQPVKGLLLYSHRGTGFTPCTSYRLHQMSPNPKLDFLISGIDSIQQISNKHKVLAVNKRKSGYLFFFFTILYLFFLGGPDWEVLC